MTSPYEIDIERDPASHETWRVVARSASEDRTIALHWATMTSGALGVANFVRELQASPATLASLLRALGRDDLADQVGV